MGWRGRGGRVSTLFGLATGIAIGVACTDLSTDPSAPFSIEFLPLASPSIVSGDSLRDIEGTATPLQAIVYNVDGEPIPGAGVSFLVVDTSGALVIDATSGHVVATGTARGAARIFASVGSLQAPPETLTIVPAPDSTAAVGTIDTLRYSFADPSRNTSDSLAILVMRDSANAGVPRYLVRFRLEDPGQATVAKLVDDQGRISTIDPSGAVAIDTTGPDGVAIRRLRITPGAGLATPIDSIVVLAEVGLRGTPVSGSPVRLVLYATPITTP
jgi:hypothetical protein